MSIVRRTFLALIALSICTSCLLSLIGLTTPAAAAPAIGPWSLTDNQPALIASPDMLNSNNCSESGPSWTCNVMLDGKNAPPSGINWSAPGGATFNPSSGTVPPGVSVTISGLPCPANENFTFTGTTHQGQIVTPAQVSWNCSVTPTPSPTPPPRPSPTPSPMPPPPSSPTPSPTATPTPRPTPTPTSRPKLTPTPIRTGVATPTPGSTPTTSSAQANSNTPPPGNGGNSPGSSSAGILFTISGLVLALLAFLLYLILHGQPSLLKRSLSLVLPISLLRRLDNR